MENLKYPVGTFTWPVEVSMEELRNAIQVIEAFPGKIRKAVEALNEEQLDTPYRPEGWTIRQVVHHCADSHMNAYIRFKLALTEDTPTIKPYDQTSWATLADSITLLPESSLIIIKGVHTRWVVIMNCMTPEDWSRQYNHPEYNKKYALKQLAVMYAWHCEHHLAHITRLIERMGW